MYKIVLGFMSMMLAMLGTNAHAVDITGVSAGLTEAQGNVETIGAAVLLIALAIAVFKWVRKAF